MSLKSRFSLWALLLVLSTAVIAQESVSVKSPDGQILLTLKYANGIPTYQVSLGAEVFMERSPLGLKTSIGDFTSGLKFQSSGIVPVSKSYDMTNAKMSHVDYRAMELTAKFTNEKNDTLLILFRVSDRDVAYSYRVKSPSHVHIKILEEASGFNLPDDATTYLSPQAPAMSGWEQTKPSYEEEYTLGQKVGTPSTHGVGYTFPALFRLQDRGWVLLSETGTDSHYPGCRLGESSADGLFKIEFPQAGENNGIGETYAAQALPAATPWRTITVGKTLKPIVETTVSFDLVDPTYEASQEYRMGRATWSWIVWQDPSMNYDDQVKFIDLASELRFEYILVDAWWDRNIGRARFEELVRYAATKNVEILLWYNSNGYWNNAPLSPHNKMNNTISRQEEMAWLQKIGVKGLKVDFFGGDKQVTMKLYEDILADANRYGLVVTFHGCTLPRGWQRMYPNFVSSEAVLASENLVFQQAFSDKHARNATILPFTRNAVGSMDFGPVFLNKRLSRDQQGGSIRRTTDAFELATSVLYFSPVQHFALTPNNLEEQPAHVLEFLKRVPTVWDETVYIGGEPQDYCAIARRKAEQWYVAVVNGLKENRTIKLDVPMLAGREVNLIYDQEDRSAGMKTIKVSKEGELKVKLLAEGGAVIFTR